MCLRILIDYAFAITIARALRRHAPDIDDVNVAQLPFGPRRHRPSQGHVVIVGEVTGEGRIIPGQREDPAMSQELRAKQRDSAVEPVVLVVILQVVSPCYLRATRRDTESD